MTCEHVENGAHFIASFYLIRFGCIVGIVIVWQHSRDILLMLMNVCGLWFGIGDFAETMWQYGVNFSAEIKNMPLIECHVLLFDQELKYLYKSEHSSISVVWQARKWNLLKYRSFSRLYYTIRGTRKHVYSIHFRQVANKLWMGSFISIIWD